MAYSTCCGAHTTMPEYGICPDCLEHCDWEDEEDDEPETDSAGFTQDDRIINGQYRNINNNNKIN